MFKHPRWDRRVAVVVILLSGMMLLAGCQSSADPQSSADSQTSVDRTSKPARDEGKQPSSSVDGGAAAAQDTPAAPEISLAQLKADNKFITSDSCKECHAEQFESWHATYHRTMTQEATSQTVRGKFDGQLIQVAGYPCQPFRDGDKFYVSVVHPAWEAQELEAGRDPRKSQQPPPITYAVDRVIGSHHQQVYLSKGPDGAYHTLPIVWDIEQNRWITRKASFLLAPSESFYHMTKLWNNGCVFCHNTGPDPGLKQHYVAGGGSQYTWETRVEELGIACEACHGPGGAHAELHRALAAESQANVAGSDAEDLKQLVGKLIVNPTKISKEESVLNCSRCHGKMIAKAEFDRQCLVEGDFFRPGEWEFVDRYDHPSRDPDEEFQEKKDGLYFWRDGTPRTTALEYQGVTQSACYLQGEMTCLSCHSMHGADPNDQLIYGDQLGLDITAQNHACTQCHNELAQEGALAMHSHHDASSSGSLCYNCHMPFQAYSLLKRTRSHRISNPSARSTAEDGIPNACNQCHVDQTLQWTHETLASWKGETPTELENAFPDCSQTVAHALAGNALQRALAVEQLGAPETFDLAGTQWRAEILIESLKDAYEANRYLAYRALKKMPGFRDFEFDYIAPPELRSSQIEVAEEIWRKAKTESIRERLLEVLGGSADSDNADSDSAELIRSLLQKRNHVDMQILE